MIGVLRQKTTKMKIYLKALEMFDDAVNKNKIMMLEKKQKKLELDLYQYLEMILPHNFDILWFIKHI